MVANIHTGILEGDGITVQTFVLPHTHPLLLRLSIEENQYKLDILIHKRLTRASWLPVGARSQTNYFYGATKYSGGTHRGQLIVSKGTHTNELQRAK